MNPTTIVAFVAIVVVGCGVLYANPKRSINRAFFLLSAIITAWLLSLGRLTAVPEIPNPVYWLRVTHAIAALIPFSLWIVKDCARRTYFDWGTVRKGWPWLVVAFLMTSLCFTGYFIPDISTREHPLRGNGWTVYIVVNGLSYLILAFQAILDLRSCSGIQKIELQTVLFGGSASGLAGILLMALGPAFRMPALSRSIPLVIVAFYSITAWGITTQKVFDARHIFRSGLRISLSLGIVAALIGLAIAVNPEFVPRPLVVIFCAILIMVLFNRFNIQILRATQLGADREAEAYRTAILAAGRDEFDYDVLIKRFGGILGTWARSEHTFFLNGGKDAFSCPQFMLPTSSLAAVEVLRLKWATPESLQRQREAQGRNELLVFMRDHGLGVLICAPGDGGLVPFIIALSARWDRIPFTWSEIRLLQEWATIIENTLSRISLTQQARESEQLKTAGLLGASLAHEIRNPLVTLKTIAQSAKARYNDPEFRRLLIELVPAEIERIEGLVSGLMDLGRPQQPHFESLRLNEVVETSVQLVRPKALDESVDLSCTLEAEPDEITADRAYLRQIILNLVMNAIQSVTLNGEVRKVAVRTKAGIGSVVLEVTDNGPGVPEEVRERLFQPFTTSNKTSGIGLGLAITADLVRLHHGQISFVDGGKVSTTFRVTLPCQQPLS
jgi:signal transduction histidine kinase